MRMRRLFQQKLSKLSRDVVQQYVAGARQFKAALCGTSALPYPINDFWTKLMGKRIVQRYGATEFGAVFKVHLNDNDVPDGSVGEKVPGIDLKLTNGDEGEILVKSPVSKTVELFSPLLTQSYSICFPSTLATSKQLKELTTRRDFSKQETVS